MQKITTLNSNKLLVDLPLNNILISIIDETAFKKMDINSNNDKLKLKKSKSVDSFVHFKNKDERKILYTNHLKIMTNDLNTQIENNY